MELVLNQLATLTDRRTYRALVYVLTAVAVAPLAFALLLAGWLAALLLSVTPASVPALLAFRTAVRWLALAEAWLARELLGSEARPAPAARRRSGFWGAGRSVLADPAFWRNQLFLAYRTTAGAAVAIGLVSAFALAGGLVALPLYYGHAHNDFGFWKVDTLLDALACVPLGIAVFAAALLLLRPIASVSRAIASGLLGGAVVFEAPDRSAARRNRRLGLAAHAAGYVLLNLVLVLTWALSHRGYFWPEWTLIALGLPLALHGWAELVELRPRLWRKRGVTKALAIHAGTSTAFAIFFVLAWAVTSHGYFWPFWPTLALLVVLAAHAVFLSRGSVIRRLEETRAGALDVQETELRRIERDLHDGAQARLVALGMSLGLAEQRLAEDPEGARQLLLEARSGIGEALQELRDLARGIHPPILADRGLGAAISALADRSPLPVDVDADVSERPAPAVETAAYFVAAEALANAAKHASPSAVHVRIARRGGLLSLAIEDDGVGGADPTGPGLRGLRQRVEALDGTLTVDSPAGGPTIVSAELPCGS